MNLKIKREQFRDDGIFSSIYLEDESKFCVALEHAYNVEGAWIPKIYPGQFTCQRGSHRLASMTEDFETFEITGVEGHSNLLFHWGNWNENSEGCILLGEAITESSHDNLPNVEMVTNSRVTFAKFMQLQSGVERFILTVEE